MKNNDYSTTKTLSKGITQLVNIISSTAFSGLIVVAFKEIFDKDFSIEDIQHTIQNISGSVVFLTPVVSSIVQMIINFKKNFYKK
jgi:hypothetical protein